VSGLVPLVLYGAHGRMSTGAVAALVVLEEVTALL
jgi:hypothetical protein